MVWGGGWDNPFHPSGSVSADADLIVRLWKERRLDKWCWEEGHDEGGKEEKNILKAIMNTKTTLML